MAKKKYASLASLQTFLENLREIFSPLVHTHKISDLTDYTVDSELSSTSTNPVQNSAIDAEFNAISDAMGALELAVDGKANATHNHDDLYYTEDEIDTKLSGINDSISNITSGTTKVADSTHADSADHASSADTSTKATQDGGGNVIVDTYETKEDAAAKLEEAKEYAENLHVVLYDEQTLTEEQKAQARKNIGANDYDWHLIYNNTGNQNYSVWAADYHMDGSSGYQFWDEAMALPSPDGEQYSALYLFLSDVADMFHKGSDDFRLARAARNGKALIDAGLLTATQSAVIVAQSRNQKETAVNCAEFSFWYNTARERIYVAAINNSTNRILSFLLDGTLKSDHIADNDKGLTIANMPADAKAVGDALALKADLDHTHEEIKQSDWDQTDETAIDFIKNKPNEEDAMELMYEMNVIDPAAAIDGSLYTDKNGVIYTLI